MAMAEAAETGVETVLPGDILADMIPIVVLAIVDTALAELPVVEAAVVGAVAEAVPRGEAGAAAVLNVARAFAATIAVSKRNSDSCYHWIPQKPLLRLRDPFRRAGRLHTRNVS